jgi:hypothetical protein
MSATIHLLIDGLLHSPIHGLVKEGGVWVGEELTNQRNCHRIQTANHDRKPSMKRAVMSSIQGASLPFNNEWCGRLGLLHAMFTQAVALGGPAEPHVQQLLSRRRKKQTRTRCT